MIGKFQNFHELICLPCLKMWRLNRILKITIVRQSHKNTRLYWYLPMNEILYFIYTKYFETYFQIMKNIMDAQKSPNTTRNLDRWQEKKNTHTQHHAAFKFAALIYFSLYRTPSKCRAKIAISFALSRTKKRRDAIGDDHFAWFD